jgi:hypothetical protein
MELRRGRPTLGFIAATASATTIGELKGSIGGINFGLVDLEFFLAKL